MPRGRSTLVDPAMNRDSESCGELLRVKLDDQALVDVRGQVRTLRQRLEHAAELLGVDLDPCRNQIHLLRDSQRFLHAQLAAGALGERNLVARPYLKGRQVDALAVHRNRAVGDKLTSLGAGNRKAHAKNDVVQTRLQLAQQVFTGVALLVRGLDVILVELALKQPVDALDL